MHKLLATSAATRPTGSPPQRKLFRIADGVFEGRLVALYMDSASGISLTYSDNPYSSWSSPQQLISDSNDSPFSAVMDKAGNIRIVYTDSSKTIKYLKLSAAAGVWNAGTPVTVVNVDDSYNPNIMIDSDAKLWCLFVNHQVSSDSKYYVRAKTSSDDGQTWGTGGSDLGTQLSAGTIDSCYVSSRQISSTIYAVYMSGRSDLKYRAYDLTAGSWGNENSIHSGDYIDDDFDIESSSHKKLGVAFTVSSDSKLYFKEFDGSQWSGLYEVENSESNSPQLCYSGNVPNIFYAKNLGNYYSVLRHAALSGDSFVLDDYSPSVGIFDSVFVYDDSSGSPFEDVTTAAADSVAGDVYHSVSLAILDAVDDCLYVGKKDRYFCAAIVLSVAGAGGAVVWEYFDGSVWKSFVPHSGAYHFDSADILVYFWEDGLSSPSDWQIGTVNGYPAYWIRARVTTAFTTSPVGSQVIPAPRCEDLVFAREGYGG